MKIHQKPGVKLHQNPKEEPKEKKTLKVELLNIKKMNLSELRLYFINGSALGVTTFTQIEDGLKVLLLLVTIGYTIAKWKSIKNEKNK